MLSCPCRNRVWCAKQKPTEKLLSFGLQAVDGQIMHTDPIKANRFQEAPTRFLFDSYDIAETGLGASDFEKYKVSELHGSDLTDNKLATPSTVVKLPEKRLNIVAHMCNTIKAVHWALSQGANGIEFDVAFEGSMPTIVGHGTPCDCSCRCFLGLCPKNHVCRQLAKSSLLIPCNAKNGFVDMLTALWNSPQIPPELTKQLAFIYIDAKLSKDVKDLAAAGTNLVNLCNEHLLSRGWPGQVLVSAEKAEHLPYLAGALKAAAQSPYAARYFYTLDGMRGNEGQLRSLLSSLGTENLVFSIGSSACANKDLRAQITQAKSQPYAGTIIWTLDKKSSMQEYINAGANTIVTNVPSNAVAVAKAMGIHVPSAGKALAI